MRTATPEERLNTLFDRTGLKDVEIARRIGVAKQTISCWRSGVRSPKRTALMKIADTFHVDVAWLLGYDDDAFVASFDGLPARESITDEERMLIAAYRAAKAEYKVVAMEILTNHKE